MNLYCPIQIAQQSQSINLGNILEGIFPQRIWEIIIVIITALITAYATSYFQSKFKKKELKRSSLITQLSLVKRDLYLSRMTLHKRTEDEIFFNFYQGMFNLTKDNLYRDKASEMIDEMTTSGDEFYSHRANLIENITKFELVLETKISDSVKKAMDKIVNYNIIKVEEPKITDNSAELLKDYKNNAIELLVRNINEGRKLEDEKLYKELKKIAQEILANS